MSMPDAQQDAWTNYIDEARLGQVKEAVIDPDIPIVDPHHHLWMWPFVYQLKDWLKDLGTGHKVVATVHTEAHGGYRESGPEHLKPVGETENLVKVAEEAGRIPGAPKVCAGITGNGDLMAPIAELDELLDAHVAAGKGRFRGIRAKAFVAFDPMSGGFVLPPDAERVVDRDDFKAGMASLTRRGLSLDLVCLHPNLRHVARLARNFPDTTIIINHLAPIADLGDKSRTEDAMMAEWRHGIDTLVDHRNVFMKLGGCANPMMSVSMRAMRALHKRAKPPASEELAAIYRPLVTYAIEKLGPGRCMFESNFPVEKAFTGYLVLWNAFKRLSQPYSPDERRMLLGGTAAEAYKLAL
jgi:predicted TIM-barrel fold metal-dependent hydrolase